MIISIFFIFYNIIIIIIIWINSFDQFLGQWTTSSHAFYIVFISATCPLRIWLRSKRIHRKLIKSNIWENWSKTGNNSITQKSWRICIDEMQIFGEQERIWMIQNGLSENGKNSFHSSYSMRYLLFTPQNSKISTIKLRNITWMKCWVIPN